MPEIGTIIKWTPSVDAKPAETVTEVLQYTRDMLAEEGRWIKGDWFKNTHPEVDPEDPFCNSWGACLDGAIHLAAQGVEYYPRTEFDAELGQFVAVGAWSLAYLPTERESQLHQSANDVLLEAIRVHGGPVPREIDYDQDGVWATVPAYNDRPERTRTQILAMLDHAIAMSQDD